MILSPLMKKVMMIMTTTMMVVVVMMMVMITMAMITTAIMMMMIMSSEPCGCYGVSCWCPVCWPASATTVSTCVSVYWAGR